MGDTICWLITLLGNSGTLHKCALSVKRDKLPESCIEHPMQAASRLRIHAWLPQHVKSIGPIVDIEPIFEVHSVEDWDDARRMRWMLGGNGYFMEENFLCGHGRCPEAEQNEARRKIDQAIIEDVWGNNKRQETDNG